MERQQYTLKDTPVGYTHISESIIGEVGLVQLSYKLYAICDEKTTLICTDAGNGNYTVNDIYGESNVKDPS